MLKVIKLYEKKLWNEIIKKKESWDIYYLNEYVATSLIGSNDQAFLFYFEKEGHFVYEVLVKKDIENFEPFKNKIPKNTYYDMSTAYGYGGPVYSNDIPKEIIYDYKLKFEEWCKKNNIISVFVRFSPMTSNHINSDIIYDLHYIKNTIQIDTTNQEQIFTNMDGKNRNQIRKAIKSNVQIKYDNGERINEFIDLYNETMSRKNARDFYFFSHEYYNYMLTEMNMNTIVFYSYLDDKVIGGSIFFYNDKYMHYHLSGVKTEYRNFCSNNLLLYEASLWAHKKGIKLLHLGGGIGIEDSLYHFKKQFNKFGELPFYLGKMVIDQEKYNFLLRVRKENDENFDANNSMLIQYRG